MFSRRQKKSTRIRNACGSTIEPLEKRVLLTTISGTGTLEYKDESGGLVRIAYQGVTAELVFAHVPKNNPNKAVLGDMVPADAPSSADGEDLFHIYLQQSTIDSFISIARVPALTATSRPMQPFSGDIAFNIVNFETGDISGVTVGVGDIILGTRTKQTPNVNNSENRPIIQAPFYGLGIMPVNKRGKLMAGLSVAPGQDLGKFLFGGTVIGSVFVPSGSIGTFYCGALLTGDARGQLFASLSVGATGGGFGEPEIPNNFYVGGDVRNLIVMGSIGTDKPQPKLDEPIYVAGTDIEIHGRSSQIRSFDTILAKTWVYNNPAAPGIHGIEQEIETENPYYNLALGGIFKISGNITDFQLGRLGDGQANFNNDTFDTPQFLGVWNDRGLGDNMIRVDGYVDTFFSGDAVDYYALPLMAGQTITVRLLNGLYVGVYDPDQRLVASNYPLNDIQTSTNGAQGVGDISQGVQQGGAIVLNEQPFQFTAKIPGIYRFAVGVFGGTATVDGAAVNAGFTGLSKLHLNDIYELRITGAGNLGLGALAATNAIVNFTNFGDTLVPPPDPSALVVNGDFGAVWVGNGTPGLLVYDSIQGKPDIEADTGDLRAVDAPQIGLAAADTTTGGGGNDNTSTTGPTFTSGGDFLANRGSIGAVRSRVGAIAVDEIRAQQHRANGIGGDIQLIQAKDFFYGNVYADRALGTLSADSMGTLPPSHIEVNADKRNNDGIIDLIDVKLYIGLVGAGGPAIITHGGNVRYMRAGGPVFRDAFFGGGSPEQTTFVQGQSADFTDDSGSQIKITPSANDLVDPTTGLPIVDASGTTLTDAGTLTVTTYPIRGGGVVLMDVQSTRGMAIYTNAARGGGAEIGRIESFGQAAPLISDPGPDGIQGTADDPKGPDGVANSGDEPLILDPNSTADNSIIMKGSRTDVLEIDGTGGFNEIRNRTGGEIVSTAITGSIDLIESGTLGIARNSTGAEIQPLAITPDAQADDPALGIATGIANAYPFRGQHSGIMVKGDVALARSSLELGNLMVDGRIASVVANLDGRHASHNVEGIDAPIFATGNIDSVNIGEGVLPTGTGDPSQAGIYAEGRIGTVFNQGLGSDIRGDIVSKQNIDTISLKNGAIIGSEIAVISTTAGSSATGPGNDLEGARVFRGNVVITTGANVNGLPQGEVSHIGLAGSGGIIGSSFLLSNLGPVEVRGGFGIFNTIVSLTGPGRMLSITTDGYGIRNCLFEGGAFSVGFNARSSGKLLNTNSFTPSVRLAQNYNIDPYFGIPTSFFTDLYFALGTSPKKPIRHASSYGGAIENSYFVASRDLGYMVANSMKNDTISYGNNITTISARSTISKLDVTAGRLDTLTTGGIMQRSHYTISGPIGNVHIGAAYRGSNSIVAQGPNGTIGNFVTDGSLFGTLEASVGINSIRVGFDVGSPNIHTGGNLGQLIANGSILAGANVSSDKTLSLLVLGGDVQQGGTVTARDILHKVIEGHVYGTVKEG